MSTGVTQESSLSRSQLGWPWLSKIVDCDGCGTCTALSLRIADISWWFKSGSYPDQCHGILPLKGTKWQKNNAKPTLTLEVTVDSGK